VIGLHAPKGRAIGSQRIGENEGVASVILGPGDGVPVAKAIELLGIPEPVNRNETVSYRV